MQQQQKTSNKGFYAKSKSYNTQNYSHNTDETPTYHGPPYKQNNSYKYSKNKKYSNDNTNYQTSSEQYVQVGRTQNENHPQNSYRDKWQHDKYNDDRHPPENTYNYPRNSRKNKNKGDSKRPDRQLYSAREKHGPNDDAKSESTNIETLTSLPNKEEPGNPESTSLTSLNDNIQETKLIHGDTFENNELLIKTNMVKGMLGIAEDKEETANEGDKSFLSTVSTALSERLKNQEEESILQHKLVLPVLPMELLPKKPEPRILLQFIIKSEHLQEKIRISEDEEDYEGIMDKICRNHNFLGRMSLYFKINFLKMICDQQRENTQAETLLQKYVDLNSKLVLYDNRLREPHDSIKPYLVSDQFVNYNMITMNTPPIQHMHHMNMRNIPGPPMYGHMGHMKQNMNQGAM